MADAPRTLNSPSSSDGSAHNTYQLSDGLARLCLPEAYQDTQQGLAWLTSICYLVLLIGVGGVKNPEAPPVPPPPQPVFVPVEVFVPQLTEAPPEQQQPEPEPEQATDNNEALPDPVASAPPEPTAVAALTPAVAFSLPTVGPVKIVSVERAESGPPTKPIPPVVAQTTTKPAGPTVFRRGSGGTSDGGFYPEPDYPPEAAKLKEQGTVTLHVIISADGSPVDVKLQQTSGSNTLDRYTSQFVRKRWKWPPGQPRQYYVPVEYRLR